MCAVTSCALGSLCAGTLAWRHSSHRYLHTYTQVYERLLADKPLANIVNLHTAHRTPHTAHRAAPRPTSPGVCPTPACAFCLPTMADLSASATGAATAESPAQKQARLRRERRAAKLADGESRLQAITALQGGTHRDLKRDLPREYQPPTGGFPDSTPLTLTAAQRSPPPPSRKHPLSQALQLPIRTRLILVNIITNPKHSHVCPRPLHSMPAQLRSQVWGSHRRTRTPCSKCCNR